MVATAPIASDWTTMSVGLRAATGPFVCELRLQRADNENPSFEDLVFEVNDRRLGP